MALPSSGEIKASQINTEAGRSSDAEAPLSGSSSTPQAGSLVKIYEDAGVDQSAPHSYSEFYGAAFSRTLTDIEYGEGLGPDDFYYEGSIGDASNLAVGDIIYTDSALTNPIDDTSYNPMGQAASSATTTFCSVTGSFMYMLINPTNGAITSVNCYMPLTDVFYDTSTSPFLTYTYFYSSSIGDASNLDVGDTVYSNAQLTTTLPADTYYQVASSATTTHCSQSGYMMSMTVNSSGAITNIFCAQP